MKKAFILGFVLIISVINAFGQQPIAEFDFDCSLEENNGIFNTITTPFFPLCECGVSDESIILSDNTDLTMDTLISSIFFDDFAISFYFKSLSSVNVQELISIGDNCSSDSTLRIYYLENSAELLVDMSQSVQRTISLRAEVDRNKCWQHVILSRNGNDFFIYVNGELKTEVNSPNDIQIGDKNPINIGFGPCVGVISNEFIGQIDELKIFDEHIQEFRAEEIYISNNEIVNNDTTIFINDVIEIQTTPICNSLVSWSPSTGVNDITNDTILLEGIESNSYIATFIEQSNSQCISTDTINIIVIDPDDVTCDDLILPNVFTPNGDGINETFHILNGFIVDELKSFEIFDRWGEVVFRTNNKSEEWDGSFKGSAVNSSMLLYKIVYVCNDVEIVKTGNVSILR